MKTLIDRVRNAHERGHSGLADDNMDGRERLFLVQAPDVQLVNGENARDLVSLGISFISCLQQELP